MWQIAPERCATPPWLEQLAGMEEVWESKLQEVQSSGAYGPRDVMIIRCRESLEGPDIVPRKEGCLTAEDKHRLNSQGILAGSWGELMRAKCSSDSPQVPSVVKQPAKEQSVMTNDH